jgi:Protein of unknown function (DUF3592)
MPDLNPELSLSPKPNSNAGRYWIAAMGMFLALAGMTFTWVLWRAYIRAEETRAWIETPCTVTTSTIRSERPSPNSNIAHRIDIRYLYQFQGQSFTGTRIKRVDGATTHDERAQATLTTYPVGLQTVCYVNPADPAFAILKQGSRAPLYSIWFPLLFVLGGLGMTWASIRRQQSHPQGISR